MLKVFVKKGKTMTDTKMMNDVTGIQRYEAMYKHRLQYFGAKDPLTIQFARILARHIIVATDADVAVHQGAVKINYKNMGRKKLLNWAQEILNDVKANVVDATYRKDIAKDMNAVQNRLSPARAKSKRLENI